MDKVKFWAKVNKNGPIPKHCPELGPCWIWTASTDGHGYGKFGSARAHRFSWLLAHGDYPKDDCLHRCDNPLCVNPDHLEDGTPTKNMLDAIERGLAKFSFGEQNGQHKLTASKVREARNRAAQGTSCSTLAFEYSVNPKTLWDAVHGVSWKHIKME